VDSRGRPIALEVTPGQLGDVRVALALISAVPPGRRLAGDAAYDSDGLRRLLVENAETGKFNGRRIRSVASVVRRKRKPAPVIAEAGEMTGQPLLGGEQGRLSLPRLRRRRAHGASIAPCEAGLTINLRTATLAAEGGRTTCKGAPSYM
jgi:hypothetical protein